MAARLTARPAFHTAPLVAAIAAAIALAAAVVACAAPLSPAPTGAVVPTAPIGVTPAIDAARSALAVKLQPAGFTLTEASGYEPGEPGSLQSVPRSVFQLNLAGPNEGWVVIYDVGTPDGALAGGADFATYLQKSGHSNYPADAQFTLNAVGGALVFHWFSRERSPDADAAAQAFALISTVGQRIPVIS